MMNKVAVVAAFGTLVAGAATSSADDHTPLEKAVAANISLLTGHVAKDNWTSTTDQMKDSWVAPEKCFEALQASGLKPSDRVYADQVWMLKDYKKDGDKSYILVSDAEKVCKQYNDLYVHEYVEAAVMEGWQQQQTMKRPVEGMYESEAQRVGIAGRLCSEWVDKALAYGMKPTDKVESTRYDMPAIELGKAKETYCQPAIDFEGKMVAAVKKLAADKHQAIVDVYKKAGIKGKRLELYVEYGMPENTGFYAAGCESTVESLGALKKAKKLFVWLEGSQGYTIRKFTFKGDNYTVTEHTYSTQEGAYRGCR